MLFRSSFIATALVAAVAAKATKERATESTCSGDSPFWLQYTNGTYEGQFANLTSSSPGYVLGFQTSLPEYQFALDDAGRFYIYDPTNTTLDQFPNNVYANIVQPTKDEYGGLIYFLTPDAISAEGEAYVICEIQPDNTFDCSALGNGESLATCEVVRNQGPYGAGVVLEHAIEPGCVNFSFRAIC